MGATFIITLREAFEATLLLGIVYTYLDKIGLKQHSRYVTQGTVLGVVASVAMGATVTFASGPLLEFGPDVIALLVIFFAVGLLTWHGWWMRQYARAIKGEIQQRIDEAEATRRLWVVGLIAFTGVFREGAETVLFLWGLFSQVGSTGAGAIIGGLAGVGTAAALGWAIYHGGKHVSLQKFFTVTSALLLLLAAGLFSGGIGKLQGLGVLPQSSTLWDTSFLLSDRGLVGSFLNGLIGYRARPTTLEATAYMTYLLMAGSLFFGHLWPKRFLRQPMGG